MFDHLHLIRDIIDMTLHFIYVLPIHQSIIEAKFKKIEEHYFFGYLENGAIVMFEFFIILVNLGISQLSDKSSVRKAP